MDSVQTHSRLAFMFDACGSDVQALEIAMLREAAAIGEASLSHCVRKGIAMHNAYSSEIEGAREISGLRTVDGAIEISILNGDLEAITSICSAMRTVLMRIAKPGSVEVMAGAMHSMVPIRGGPIFLSLAFRRFPGTSVSEFRRWWHDQHAPLAIPVLTEELLLAYDQVHVDEQTSRAAAKALGVNYSEYDAYDNLTFESAATFSKACSDSEGMARLAEDESSWIDNFSRRHALMREI